MDVSNCCDVKLEQQQPEFVELISRFRKELEELGRNTYDIREKVRLVREFQSEPVVSSEPPLIQSGYLHELIECYEGLRSKNNELRDIRLSLTELLG